MFVCVCVGGGGVVGGTLIGLPFPAYAKNNG